MARVLALLLVLVLPGCAAWQKSGAPAAIECAGDKLATRVVLAVPLVLAVLDDKASDDAAKWKQLAVVVGADVVSCALQYISIASPAHAAKAGKAALTVKPGAP